MPNITVRGRRDMWTEWLQDRRHGCDASKREEALKQLRPIRDKILTSAQIPRSGVVLDIGCGDGLLGFGVLEKYAPRTVVFQDISDQLITICRRMARSFDLLDRCAFECCSATALCNIGDSTIDSVVSRSVLMYVKEKKTVLEELHRVLKAGGTMSLFEPIMSLTLDNDDRTFLGYAPTGVDELLRKVKDRYSQCLLGADAMLDLDDRMLFQCCADIGFREVTVETTSQVIPKPKWDFDIFRKTALSPHLPTLDEVIDEVLNTDEKRRFVEAMRPMVCEGRGIHKQAFCYVCARKSQ